MYKRKIKCIKPLIFEWQKKPYQEQFSKGVIYEAIIERRKATLYINAINNNGQRHGIGTFLLFGLIKNDFFKEHFVFIE